MSDDENVLWKIVTSIPIFGLAKVLNFFPVLGDEKECLADNSAFPLAKSGVCLNPYECHQRNGLASGDCAYGLGVCCLFTETCGAYVNNNLTFFMSPGFPELWPGQKDCNLTINKIHEGVTQFRIDFIHFNIGQPNRSTGECDGDSFNIYRGGNTFQLCGQNHGQHLYFDFISVPKSREDGELPSNIPTVISIRTPEYGLPRLWILRIIQLPLVHSAPHGCTQYYTGNNGTISTFNYAVNGRHLTSQHYTACVRKEVGVCAVRYTLCQPHSFRIGRPRNTGTAGPGSNNGAGTGFYGPDGQFVDPNDAASDPIQDNVILDDDTLILEGSGDEPSSRDLKLSSDFTRWSPYTQYTNLMSDDPSYRYSGYGYFGTNLFGYGNRRCVDRITIPCDNEQLLWSGLYKGVCDPHHCGSTFCESTQRRQFRTFRKQSKQQECYVETTVTPFTVQVHFGPPSFKSNPEDNIGACIKYHQIGCED